MRNPRERFFALPEDVKFPSSKRPQADGEEKPAPTPEPTKQPPPPKPPEDGK